MAEMAFYVVQVAASIFLGTCCMLGTSHWSVCICSVQFLPSKERACHLHFTDEGSGLER